MSIIQGTVNASQWFNNGFNFDGSTNFIQTTGIDKVNDLTLSVFFNSPNIGANDMFIFSYGIFNGTNSYLSYSLRGISIVGGGVGFKILLDNINFIFVPFQLLNNKLYHIALVFNYTNLISKLYVNGISQIGSILGSP